MQTIGWWTRPISFLERGRGRYGKRFTVRLLQTPPFVMLSDPDEVRQVFTAPPDVLHPGEGARILEPVIGANSVILLDEAAHLEQRKLMLPAFHGEKMQRLAGLMAEVAEREAERWPRSEPLELHPRMQGLTLEVILRAAFGLDPGPRLDALRERLTDVLALGARPLGMLPFLQRDWGGRGPWARFVRLREEIDALLFELIAERRAEHARARRRAGDAAGGAPRGRLADDRAGASRRADDAARGGTRDHRLGAGVGLRAPGAHAGRAGRLRGRDRLGRRRRLPHGHDPGDAARAARASQRRAAPGEAGDHVGGWTYEPGTCLVPNAYLVHHDPEIYPDPYAFRPERFLDEPPGTYTWIPFGGGRRRCLGASFALMEMKIVLRAVLSTSAVAAGGAEAETTRRRAITLSPRGGASAVLRDRASTGERPPMGAPAAAAV